MLVCDLDEFMPESLSFEEIVDVINMLAERLQKVAEKTNKLKELIKKGKPSKLKEKAKGLLWFIYIKIYHPNWLKDL